MDTGLLAEYSRWGRTIDHKMVAVHGSPCESTPLILILILSAAHQDTTRVQYSSIIRESNSGAQNDYSQPFQ
jgi:hypothetical protein